MKIFIVFILFAFFQGCSCSCDCDLLLHIRQFISKDKVTGDIKDIKTFYSKGGIEEERVQQDSIKVYIDLQESKNLIITKSDSTFFFDRQSDLSCSDGRVLEAKGYSCMCSR